MSPAVVSYVVQTSIILVGVSALAVLILYGARRAGLGRPNGPLELLGKLPLDGRRAVYLVRAGSTTYVIGASEAGLVKLGEGNHTVASSSAEVGEALPTLANDEKPQ
ncbi:MAG: flagellar biosynthetic protein FliO [Polyangiaceae bacterium]|nr:flagellar biosynthetic protein FliO [Polyangiaceae bacterium]